MIHARCIACMEIVMMNMSSYAMKFNPGESYLVDAEVAVVGMDNVLDASEGQFELDWAIQAPFHERSRKQEQQKTTVFYKHFDDKADYISESNYEVEKFEAAVQWVAFKTTILPRLS